MDNNSGVEEDRDLPVEIVKDPDFPPAPPFSRKIEEATRTGTRRNWSAYDQTVGMGGQRKIQEIITVVNVNKASSLIEKSNLVKEKKIDGMAGDESNRREGAADHSRVILNQLL